MSEKGLCHQRLRVLSGKYRNYAYRCVHPRETRPTAQRVRSTVFNIVVHRFLKDMVGKESSVHLNGKRILDLFAGTGGYGLEALSRGADHVTFVDYSDTCVRAIHEALQAFGLTSSSQVIKCTLPQLGLLGQQPYDMIFIDPPYDKPLLLRKTLQALGESALVSEQTLIISEREYEKSSRKQGVDLSSPETYAPFNLLLSRRAQRAEILFMSKASSSLLPELQGDEV